MYGRSLKFIEENLLSFDLWKRFTAGERDILRPAKLLTIPAGKSTPVTGQITIWTPHEFQYPAILKPISQLTATPASAQSGKLFAFMGENPDNPPNIGTYAKESRGGLLVIPIPGQWWLGYDGPVDSSVQVMSFDDTCGAAQHLLSKENHILREPGAVNVLTAAATQILGDDQYRDGAFLQNQGTVDVWIRFGSAATNPAAVGTGYKIPPDETIDLASIRRSWKGPVNGRANGANASVWPVEVLS